MSELNSFLEEELPRMIERQESKVLGLARERDSTFTIDDIRNPQDHPILMQDAQFNFEDGILAGYLNIQTLLRSRYPKEKSFPKYELPKNSRL